MGPDGYAKDALDCVNWPSGFVGEPLELEELDELCINFGLGKASATKRPGSGAALR